MARENVERMYECFPKHLRMGTARLKYEKETDEDGKKRGLSMKKSKTGTKERSPDCLSVPKIMKNTI